MKFKSGNINIFNGSKSNGEDGSSSKREGGMDFKVTTFFLVAQMAGAGFLALPSALAATGWFGVPLTIIFCGSAAYTGTILAHCWMILEERWPQYRNPQRQPYVEIAYRSFGSIGRKVILVTLLITLIGVSIVMLILIADFLQSMIPNVSPCLFIIIMAIASIPFSWLGTPKDIWQASVLAAVATAIACVIIVIQMIIDKDSEFMPTNPAHDNPTFVSFSLGFSAILFAFGGAAVFPTLQNDMADRSQFWKSVIVAYACLIILYLPVAVTGYALLGTGVPGNILLYRGMDLSVILKIAIAFEIINLMATFLIILTPISLILEEMFNIPNTFGYQRVIVRSSLVIFDLIVALALPEFGLILNLIGGSTVALSSFIAPCAMYLKLVNDKSNPDWSQRSLPLWEKIFLYQIVSVGFIGAVCSTGSAIAAIINADFSQSCFTDFN